MASLRQRRMKAMEDPSTRPLLEEDYSQQTQPETLSDAAQDKQLIVHPGPFDLDAFLRTIIQWWHTFLGLLHGCLQVVFPGHHEFKLSLIQEERLDRLQQRLSVSYDGSNPEHQLPFISLKTSHWKEMGWQGDDPSTDFRGAGLLGLYNLIYLGEQYPAVFHMLMNKTNGVRADWEYPFAAAGINLTYILTELLELQKPGVPPSSSAGRAFASFLTENECAFDELYCASYQLLDTTWLDMRASYMQFNNVVKAVKARLQQILAQRNLTLDQACLIIRTSTAAV